VGAASTHNRFSNTAFDDPSAAQHLEACGGGAAFDDLDDDVGLVLGPVHEPPGIAPVGKARVTKG
jgi:hypothetical protein